MYISFWTAFTYSIFGQFIFLQLKGKRWLTGRRLSFLHKYACRITLNTSSDQHRHDVHCLFTVRYRLLKKTYSIEIHTDIPLIGI